MYRLPCGWAATLLLLGTLHAAEVSIPIPVPREDIVRNAAPGALRHLDRIADPAKAGRFGVRELFAQALVLCEAKQGIERIDILFAAAEPLQDRDRASPTYGNLKWYSDDTRIVDRNAVDFCMQSCVPLWLRHRDALPAAARERLRGLIACGIDGLKGHQVRPSYTNIALMNAGNLIVLGEAFDRTDAADEGYARLGRILTTMWEEGIHEYNSPTYYGVDLEDLQLIAAFARREHGRQQAETLLRYFWTDLALNWFPAAQKMAGARSRDYDYLRGLGMLDQHLTVSGWLPADPKAPVRNILCAFTAWHPPAELWTLAQSPKPRLVESVWGSGRDQARACWVCPDVALSAAGAGYGGRMDFPLCVDLPGPRIRPRLFLVPDGRQDPYGKAKILEGGSGHMKALHLSPFWVAAQRRADALGLVVYRDKDLPADTTGMQSHIVIPRDVDGFWIGDRRVTCNGAAADHALADGQALVLRQGTAAVGMRLVWARDRDGQAAAAHLIDDGNPHGVVRLTVDHRWEAGKPTGHAGAAFWVRVGSGLADEAAFTAWRTAFARATMEVQAVAERVTVRVTGTDGPLALTAEAPFAVATTVEPAWPRHLLACDGDDIGRRLLADVPPIREWRERRARVKPVAVSGATLFEAEAGFATEPVVVAEDAQASGGRFTWMPVVGEDKPPAAGGVSWPLVVAAAGPHYLWGRVRAATPSHDSFLVALEQDGRQLIANATWAIGVRREWTWVRFTPEGAKIPTPIALPAGRSELILRTREAGAQIDRLFLSPTADGKP